MAVKVQFWIEEEELERLRQTAQAENVSVSEFVRRSLRREAHVHVRCTVEERDRWETLAAGQGLSLSEFVRRQMSTGEPPPQVRPASRTRAAKLTSPVENPSKSRQTVDEALTDVLRSKPSRPASKLPGKKKPPTKYEFTPKNCPDAYAHHSGRVCPKCGEMFFDSA